MIFYLSYLIRNVGRNVCRLSFKEHDTHRLIRLLLIDSHHIGWSIVLSTHTTSTTLSDGGRSQPLVDVRKLKVEVSSDGVNWNTL